jgi:hypothetical protein
VPIADVIGRSRLAGKPTSRIEDGLCFTFLYRRQAAEPRLGGARPVLVNRDHLIALPDSADAQAYHSGTLSNEPRVDWCTAIGAERVFPLISTFRGRDVNFRCA